MKKNQLDQLKQFTTLVADTGDLDAILQYHPIDATTNPSLIFAASQKPEYQHLIEEALFYEKNLQSTLDHILINFGEEILKIIPGRVSIEIDARLSYDTKKSVEKAREIISLFEKRKIDRSRILIKLATTYEGILAAEILEKEKIHCNMTLLFNLTQALAAAEAKATIISPFVGRILDWYKKNHPTENFSSPEKDPGVQSVTTIYNHYKTLGYQTQIMGASFRSKEEILSLAGCDFLTIAPKFLEELKKETTKPVSCKLSMETALSQSLPCKKKRISSLEFAQALKEDAMAREKLQEGIQNFVSDIEKLELFLQSKLLFK